MRNLNAISVAAAIAALVGLNSSDRASAASSAPGLVYENPFELVTTGDFNGDGRLDAVIVDRASGKYRVAYQWQPEVLTWTPVRLGGVAPVTGVAVGRFFDPKKDALALTSVDGVSVNVIDISTTGMVMRTVTITPECLGPNVVAGIDIGGAGNTPEHDLYIGSIYNVDPETLGTLFRNQAGKFAQIAEGAAPGLLALANRLALKDGGPEYLCAIVRGKGKDSLVVQDFASGKPEIVAQTGDLPAGAAYVAGHFRGQPLKELVVYKPGDKQLIVRPVEEAGGKLQFGAGATFALEQPVDQLLVVGRHLLAFQNTNEPAILYSFDGVKAPVSVQTFACRKTDIVSGALAMGGRFDLFFRASLTRNKYSIRSTQYKLEGNEFKDAGTVYLPTLDVDDGYIIPKIHARIANNLDVKSEADMKAYTNTIPGSPVPYVMLPIRGGEFLMGSPASEKGRKPDEGPQHKVKVEPFWMGQFEVGWNEYDIFTFTNDEVKLRATYPTDPEVNKISDAVTRPSSPYADMSFGMGRDGFPAIGMTQHGANKYCMWLSAKTGHFYRLPTEAEWEYACRAGTTTAYSFGDDASKLKDHGWYEDNSDVRDQWKYHKLGSKKPNPWGLFDMHGNVAEWCLDQYEPNYERFAGSEAVVNPWVKATEPYPHVVRGGSYDFQATACRSAARLASTKDWKAQDPQLPKSVWYFTDEKYVGFRFIRPLKIVTAKEMQGYWKSGVEKDP